MILRGVEGGEIIRTKNRNKANKEKLHYKYKREETRQNGVRNGKCRVLF